MLVGAWGHAGSRDPPSLPGPATAYPSLLEGFRGFEILRLLYRLQQHAHGVSYGFGMG